jgi:hypothetical protein
LFSVPRRQAHLNNLMELALAMHNHQSTFNRLPASATRDPAGRPLLSWRVAVLPFLGQDVLYRQFHLNEPWDSPHNIALLPRMPKVFALPGTDPSLGKTCYQVFVGDGTPWPGDGRSPPSLAMFPDGTSNTILLAEAANHVEWTKPDDMLLAPGADPHNLLGRAIDGSTFFVAMADGSVRRVPVNVTTATLRNAINPADGNVLGDDFGR